MPQVLLTIQHMSTIVAIAGAATCIAAPIVQVQNPMAAISNESHVFMFERCEFEDSYFQVICFFSQLLKMFSNQSWITSLSDFFIFSTSTFEEAT